MTVGSKRSVSVTTDPCDNSDHFIFNADVMRYHDNLFSSSEPVQGVGEETLAPLMTSCAFTKGSQTSQEKKTAHQFGLLARAIEGSPSVVIEDPRVFYNITPPSSTFICGSQGSGKSHTLSCILESCLIPSKAGQLPNPLTGIVFHYDTFISDTMGSPCEAAFLSSHPDIEVRVLCAPTNLHAIKGAYSRLNIAVSALEIDQRNLNTKRMLDLMAVGQDDGPMPLYMHTVKRILREMRMEQQAAHTGFDYRTFKNKVLDSNLTPAQLEPLKQRLEMLESFMPQLQTLPISGKNKAASEGIDWKPKARRLTVVDLSCPCISPETACSLFNICLGIFLEQDPGIGRVVALDEAHKYMNSSLEARGFTETLLSAVRLQRHLGVRMIISTQEPTVSTTLLNLCSTTIVHRFTSPEWLHILHKHLAGALRSPFGGSKTDNHDTEAVSQLSLFEEIVNLQVGEAILFSPSMVVKASSCDSNGKATLCRLGHGNLRVRIRQRLTLDGGKSVLSR